MSSADEWRTVCGRLARADASEKSALTKQLYSLARETGIACLRRQWSYSEDEALDLVHDVLARSWDEILAAEESPKALFATMLVNSAISAFRRRTRREKLATETVPKPADAASPESSLELADALRLLQDELSPRDLRVFGARCLGESAKDVADVEGLSPANVDQIVSRARARLKELTDADPE